MRRGKMRLFLVSAGLCLLAISTWLWAKPYILGDPSSGAPGSRTAQIEYTYKHKEIEVLIPKSWGSLKGVLQDQKPPSSVLSGMEDFFLFFEGTDGTICIAKGFVADDGRCELQPFSVKIKRSPQ